MIKYFHHLLKSAGSNAKTMKIIINKDDEEVLFFALHKRRKTLRVYEYNAISEAAKKRFQAERLRVESVIHKVCKTYN